MKCEYCGSTDGQRSKYRPNTCLHCGGELPPLIESEEMILRYNSVMYSMLEITPNQRKEILDDLQGFWCANSMT